MIRPVLIAALCLAAAACASPRQEAENALVNPLQRFPLVAAEQADDTMLAVHPTGLSSNQRAALAETAARWREAGGPPVLVRVPDGAPQSYDARAMAEQISVALAVDGVAPEAVRIEGYDAMGDASAPIIARFASFQAEIPRCGLSWDNLTGTQSNNNHANFGCAVSANMAAQIANPADIAAPREMTPAEASRRALVIDNYRKGQPTGAQIDPAGSGAVSQAVP